MEQLQVLVEIPAALERRLAVPVRGGAGSLRHPVSFEAEMSVAAAARYRERVGGPEQLAAA